MAEVNIQTVNLTGYKAQVNGAQYLRLGTWDSYGIEQLQIVPGPEWTGLVIKAVFVTAAGTTPVVVPDSGLINVPPPATPRRLPRAPRKRIPPPSRHLASGRFSAQFPLTKTATWTPAGCRHLCGVQPERNHCAGIA